MLKLVLAGDGGVGKTSLARKYVTGEFEISTKITLGIDLFKKEFTIEDLGSFYLQIWDFGGEKRFRNLLPPYCTGAHGVLYLFSITDVSSLYNFTEWLDIIHSADKNIPILLVGAKSDLRTSRKIQTTEAMRFAQKNNCIGYIETSAKTGANVEKAFEMITREMWKNIQKAQKEIIKLSEDERYYYPKDDEKE